MELEDNQEIDVCDDSMNNEYPEKVDQSKYNDDQGISASRESIYLSASDLFRLRRDICKNKGKDENVDATKGLKLYTPSDSSQDRETMENLLLNHKNSLKLPRGAKIRDCVKGEWNEELKVAIVPHLKGKSTQHMGHNFKGKIALSPEEALFLLEKNCIEVSRNNMPMSIEEAFTVMLKEKLALEKYQVYSHLSQQGFIVVKHQTRIGPRYEEIMNLSKKKQRKRKATNLDEEPGEKRLTFTGVLASNVQSKVTVNAEESILSSDCEVLNSNDFVNKTDTVAKDCNVVKTTDHVNTNELLVSVSSQDGAVLPDTTNQIELMDLNENDSLKSLSCVVESENNSLKSPSVAFENENIKNSFVAIEKEMDSLKSSSVIGKINDSFKSPSGAIEKENDSLKSSSGAVEKENDSLKSPSDVTENENNSLKSSSAIVEKETDSLKSLSGATENKNDSLNNPSGITEKENDTLRSPTGVNENDLLKISCVTEKENGSFKIPSGATENENDSFKSSSGVTEKENDSLKSSSVTIEATNKLKTVSDDNVSSVDSEILSILGTSDSAVKISENMDVSEVDDNKQKANSCIEICENEVSTELNEMELTESSIKPPENIAVQDVIEELNGNNTNKIDKSSDKSEIEVENINDINEIIIDSCHEFDKSENINVDTLSSNYDHDYSSDESISLVCEDESESADVLSCTSNDQESSFDDIISQSSDIYTPKDHDDEITLIEIKKKENTPLAVIDLLSDDEQEAEKNDETFEGSDDEIQVVKVCNVANSNARNSSRNISSIKSECKNENTQIRSSNEIKSSFRPQMKFPEMFRKDVLCLPRPPANLLPNHVRPAKEAYVINRNNKSAQPNKGRLWNSFRDMQEYQRERRRERQSNNSRPFNSLRDFRFQNNDSHHNNRMSPFNQQENSRDSGFDRNNQNYGFQQTASPFNPPMSMSPQLTRGPNLLPSPNVFTTPNQLPFMNIPSLHNLSSTNPVAFVNEFQKTVYSVATNMLSSMLGQHLNPMNPATRSSPTFSEPPPYMGHNSHNQYNNFASQPPMVQDHMAFNANSVSDFHPVRFPSEPTFSGERFPSPMNRGSMFENNWRPNNFRPRNFERKGPLFPCPYREVRRKRCWGDVKAAVAGSIDNPSDSGSDIEEVPINLNQFLWSNDIQPLVKPGQKLPVFEVLQKLQITQKANLLDTKRNVDKYMPQPPTLEISFDVYLPGSKYKKTSPGVPKHRIVVLRSADPIPKYSELVFLQKKWNDEAVIQIAIVDHGDTSFYSFNNVDLNGLVPHEE